MKLSIVIPVYRVEATLDRCVESVLAQDWADMEVILVDDGSPDKCPQMCDAWAGRDARIRVIHKPNGGLSDARNAGIDSATGDYITFVDSDDYLGAGTYRPLMELLERDSAEGEPHEPAKEDSAGLQREIDLLEYPIHVFFDSPRQHLLRFEAKTYTDMEAYWLDGEAYAHTYACNKLYRARLLREEKFEKGRLFEDVECLPRLLRKAKRVQTSPEGLYYYCANPSGITATADGRALRMLLQPHVEIISRSKRRDEAFSRYYMHVLNIQMDVSEQAGDAPTLPFIHQDPAQHHGLARLKAIALNILGIKGICKLNKAIHKVWRNR